MSVLSCYACAMCIQSGKVVPSVPFVIWVSVTVLLHAASRFFASSCGFLILCFFMRLPDSVLLHVASWFFASKCGFPIVCFLRWLLVICFFAVASWTYENQTHKAQFTMRLLIVSSCYHQQLANCWFVIFVPSTLCIAVSVANSIND